MRVGTHMRTYPHYYLDLKQGVKKSDRNFSLFAHVPPPPTLIVFCTLSVLIFTTATTDYNKAWCLL